MSNIKEDTEAAPSPSPAPGVVTDIRAKIEAQHVKVSGDDGYNYAAGQEYGLRQALIIVDAALASLSQPAKGEGEGGGVEPFDDKWLGDGGSIHVLHTTPANPAQGVIRQIVEDALNSAIPEPWEVAEHATQRILAAIGAGNEPFQLVEESDEVGTQMVVASTIGAGGQAVASGAEWYRVDGDGSILLYTLMQDGWRKGEPVMVNDVMVRVEAANGSKTPIAPIAERILSAIAHPVQPGWRDMPAPTEKDIIVIWDDEKIEIIKADDNDFAWTPYPGKSDCCSRPVGWLPLDFLPAAPQTKGE